MKGKLVKITVLFFIVMILFTILSRVTYNMSMATVETTQLQGKRWTCDRNKSNC